MSLEGTKVKTERANLLVKRTDATSHFPMALRYLLVPRALALQEMVLIQMIDKCKDTKKMSFCHFLRRVQAILLTVVLACPTLVLAEDPWQTQLLPWGHPDLQGTWNSATLTGLERMAGIEELVVSEEKALVLENRDAGYSAEIDRLPPGELPSGDVVGGYNSAWLDRGTQLLRVNGEARTSIVVHPENGKVPYTLVGFTKYWWSLINSQKRNNPEEQLLGDRCVVGYGSTGGPPMLPVLYNNNYQFIQTPSEVLILVEMNHAVRRIRLEGDALPQQIRPWFGDSIGHWEGDTLVVETSQFHPQQSMRGAIKHQLYVGLNSKITERFTRVAEDEIHYEFTVEDDEIYRQPWRGEMAFRPSDGDIYEYACHEGNYGMTGMLAGERKQGSDGLLWLYGLMTNMPEEVSHKQLSPARFER
ncbi:MAG: hypothetical protein ACI9UU_000452 [Candidatus Azotimanducaceae bacterium]